MAGERAQHLGRVGARRDDHALRVEPAALGLESKHLAVLIGDELEGPAVLENLGAVGAQPLDDEAQESRHLERCIGQRVQTLRPFFGNCHSSRTVAGAHDYTRTTAVPSWP